ncbi:PAS domain-containing protein [Alteribacter natronophilus]|uniref:PAS domain-containing protein n=1 Tax=Alteribacter natronophilus TaxID=2583810 RepID=UPI00110F50F4|nr:PAS domain-containing protein [Alteribacter natronophilus]TMW73470.1 PAS domain-containing protein [Alteribacter natronophilus]
MAHTLHHSLSPDLLIKAMDYTRVGVIMTDPDLEDHPIVYANRAFEEMTGYSADEFIGKNCRFLQGADTDADEVAKIREAVNTRQSVTVTIKNYRKNGEAFWNELHIDPVFDEANSKRYFVGVQKDVTDYRTAKEELLLSIDEVSRLSTPIVPVEEGVSVLPLIGNITEKRLETILTNITAAVSDTKDHTLILDLSGLNDINEHVIQGIFNLHDLLRLLGTSLIITGISTKLAIKATGLQIDLSQIRTFSTVKEAIQLR